MVTVRINIRIHPESAQGDTTSGIEFAQTTPVFRTLLGELMERAVRISIGVILLGIALPVATQEVARSSASFITFMDVNIVRPENAHIDRHQTVVVSGKKIIAIGPTANLQPPPGAQRIEAHGAYLLAGLAEMHAHVPHQPASDEYLQDVLFLWAANGITTILARGFPGGQADHASPGVTVHHSCHGWL